MLRLISIFQLYILGLCIIYYSQKSCDDSLFLDKCSTEKLCLLADVMFVSMMLRIMVNHKKKSCFQKIMYWLCNISAFPL